MLRQPETGATPSLADDVATHVAQLLNSRQGQALAAPHFGMALSRDAVRDALLLLPQTVPLLEQALLQTLAAHELRLHLWRLWQPTEVAAHALTVFVAARVQDGPEHEVHFTLDIEASGRVAVRLS